MTPTCARQDEAPYAAAAPPATSNDVEMIPAGAQNGRRRSVTRGKNAAVSTPAPSGARTRDDVLARIAACAMTSESTPPCRRRRTRGAYAVDRDRRPQEA